jgi:predicted nucleotidyltransferase component of viral defense system
LLPINKILSLSFHEAVAEKFKAAISRKVLAIRDYYDLQCILDTGFDFHNKKFLTLLKKKLEQEVYLGDYKYNFGLDHESINLLQRQVETDLIPVIRSGEKFELAKVLAKFNGIL